MSGSRFRHDIVMPFAPREPDLKIRTLRIQLVNGTGMVSVVGRVDTDRKVLAVVGRIFRGRERVPPRLVYPPRHFVWARIDESYYYFDAAFPSEECRLTGATAGADNFIVTWALLERVPYWVRVNCERQFFGDVVP
jgi:hypothetical protein